MAVTLDELRRLADQYGLDSAPLDDGEGLSLQGRSVASR